MVGAQEDEDLLGFFNEIAKLSLRDGEEAKAEGRETAKDVNAVEGERGEVQEVKAAATAAVAAKKSVSRQERLARRRQKEEAELEAKRSKWKEVVVEKERGSRAPSFSDIENKQQSECAFGPSSKISFSFKDGKRGKSKGKGVKGGNSSTGGVAKSTETTPPPRAEQRVGTATSSGGGASSATTNEQPEERWVCLDTNTLMSELDAVQWLQRRFGPPEANHPNTISNSVIGVGGPACHDPKLRCFVPWVLWRELDGLKSDCDSRKAFEARSAIRWLTESLLEQTKAGPAYGDKGKGGGVKTPQSHRWLVSQSRAEHEDTKRRFAGWNGASTDDEIVASARALAEDNALPMTSVTILTGDVNMQGKALVDGLGAERATCFATTLVKKEIIRSVHEQGRYWQRQEEEGMGGACTAVGGTAAAVEEALDQAMAISHFSQAQPVVVGRPHHPQELLIQQQQQQQPQQRGKAGRAEGGRRYPSVRANTTRGTN